MAGGACIRIGQSGLCPNTSDWKETVNGVRYSSSTIGDSSKFTEAMVGSTRSKWGYFDYEIESDSRDNNVRIPATENAPPRFGLWCLALALALTRSGFVSLLFKPSHTLLPHSLFFFLPPSPFSPLATYQLSSNSVYQLFRTMVSIPCSLPVIPRALSHHPCQSHNSPESSPHPPSMENDSHQDAHVHGLRLVLGSILAPVRPLLPSYPPHTDLSFLSSYVETALATLALGLPPGVGHGVPV